MWQRLTLFKRLNAVNLSPEEAEGFLERLQTHCSPAHHRDRFAQVIRTTTEASDQLVEASTWQEESASKCRSPAR